MGAFAVGNCIVMPSIILEKMKENNEDSLTFEQGSWFGNQNSFYVFLVSLWVQIMAQGHLINHFSIFV